MRKLLLIALSAAVVSGATPALAQIAGSWEGTGTGSCPNPTSNPVETMRPWNIWSGEIPDDESTFSGEWHDPAGVHGTFTGEATFATPEEVVFTGTWNAIDDLVDPPVIYEMGTFYMHFPYTARACHGEWVTYDSDIPQGTMTGHRTDG